MELKLLIITEKPEFIEELTGKIQNIGYRSECKIISDTVQLDEALEERPWDLVIADDKIPNSNGSDVINIIKAKTDLLPIIILSEEMDEEMALKMLRIGASDYLLKANLSQLVLSIEKIIVNNTNKKNNYIDNYNKKHEGIFDFLPDATFVINAEGEIIIWNKEIEKMTGVSRNEMIGKNNYQYAIPFYGERRPMLLDLFLDKSGFSQMYYYNAIKIDNYYTFESEYVNVKSEELFLISKAAALYDHENKIIGVMQTIWDATERKRNIEMREMYSALFNNAKDIIIIGKKDGTIIDANVAALRTYGYTKEEMKALKIFDLRIDEEKTVKSQLTKAYSNKGDKGINYESLHIRKDGSTFEVEANVIGINSNGQSFQMAIIRDISLRKKYERALRQTVSRIEEIFRGSIEALSITSEKRDLYTSGHQKKVAEITLLISKHLKLKKIQTDNLRIAALLHDIGKINIPSEILTKPSALTQIEYELMKTHVESGYEIVRKIPFDNNIAMIILQHHERIDGSGYPQGLKDPEILFEAKILAVADVLDAMTSHRPYRASLGLENAIAELVQNKNTLYEGQIVEIILELYQRKELQKILQEQSYEIRCYKYE